MSNWDQNYRILKIKTDLPEQDTLILSVSGHEAINDSFIYTVDMLSTNLELDGKQLIGSNVSVSIHKDGDEARYINGLVTKVTRSSVSRRDYRRYSLEIKPWTYFLSKRENCRIFQKKSVLDIIESLFKEHGYADYKVSAKATEKREYIVQYNEPDWHFVQRLLQEEGLNFYFEHENGLHRLVICDTNKGFAAAPESKAIFNSGTMEADHISHWDRSEQFISSETANDSYDFTTPNKPLANKHNSAIKLTQGNNASVYEYLGDYDDNRIGKSRNLFKLEAEEASFDLIEAQSSYRSFNAGQLFELAGHDSKRENGKFLIKSIQLLASQPGPHSEPDEVNHYQNAITCQPEQVPARPRMTLVKPLQHGPHRAVVVGPAGEEIYVDKYGRIKVQFKWDRYRKGDENDSCWLRVTQSWAGNGFGSQFIPRIGTEVIVDFFQGDIDQPFVAGCLYNGESAHPFELPANKTQSGIKTLSSKGAKGFNAIRLEDKKGEEEFFIHGEKDYRKVVKNDAFEEIGNNAERHVTKDQSIKIDENRHELIGKNSQLEIKEDFSEKTGANKKVEIGKQYSLKVDGDTTEEHNGNFANKTKDKFSVDAKSVVIEGEKEITLRVGGSEIVLTTSSIEILAKALIKQKAGTINLN